jgi:hypothetical protein
MQEVISVGLLTSFVNTSYDLIFVIAFPTQTVQDVFSHSAREKNWLLLDNCNMLMVPSWVKLSDINSIEENLTLIRVIKPLNHCNY